MYDVDFKEGRRHGYGVASQYVEDPATAKKTPVQDEEEEDSTPPHPPNMYKDTLITIISLACSDFDISKIFFGEVGLRLVGSRPRSKHVAGLYRGF